MEKFFEQNLRLYRGLNKARQYFVRFRPDRAIKMLIQRLSAEQFPAGRLVEFCINDSTTINLRPRTTDIYIFEQIFLIRDCLPPKELNPELIIDGGAHIGCSAIYFAQIYPRAQVIAVEANESNFELLKLNAAPFKNITCIHGAIWDSITQVCIANPDEDSWGYRVKPLDSTAPTASVSGITIGDLFASSGRKRIGLLKLDIEGAEAKVFSGKCESWLSVTDAIMIELHDRFQPGCTESFFSAINPFGFKLKYRSENNVTVMRIPLDGPPLAA